jgi:hypothetical protein
MKGFKEKIAEQLKMKNELAVFLWGRITYNKVT